MSGNLQPLDSKFAIVGPDGRPTDYFTRWAQQRQIDISDGITLLDLEAFLTAHKLVPGVGIQFAPDGDINNRPVIHADVQAILDEITATRGTILYRGLLGWAALAPGTAGNFLQTAGAGLDPLWAAGGGGGGGSGLFPINAPPAFATWVNQGTATVTTNSDSTISVVGALDGAENIRGVFRALPATPWAYKIGFVPQLGSVSFQNCGIALRESSSGKMVVFCAYCEANNSNSLWFVANYNSPTSKNANLLIPSRPLGNVPTYLKIADDGTTRTAAFGFDPYVQKQAAYSVAHNSFIVPDQIGIIASNLNTTTPLSITVFSWQ